MVLVLPTTSKYKTGNNFGLGVGWVLDGADMYMLLTSLIMV